MFWFFSGRYDTIALSVHQNFAPGLAVAKGDIWNGLRVEFFGVGAFT